ncbi:MAG TPA: TRAP transporter small permease, partial [Caldimonas sp.]
MDNATGRWLVALTRWIEYLSAAVLASDVIVVFTSVIYRYVLHDPFDWAEEIARALMLVLVFFGAATVLARSRHVGVDLFRQMFPARWQATLMQSAHWVVAGVSASLCISSVLLVVDTWTQTSSIGLPQWLYVFPVVIGSFFMTLFGAANAL